MIYMILDTTPKYTDNPSLTPTQHSRRVCQLEYKIIYSEYNNHHYEHTFAVGSLGAIYPISLRRIGPRGETSTWLFISSINTLLKPMNIADVQGYHMYHAKRYNNQVLYHGELLRRNNLASESPCKIYRQLVLDNVVDNMTGISSYDASDSHNPIPYYQYTLDPITRICMESPSYIKWSDIEPYIDKTLVAMNDIEYSYSFDHMEYNDELCLEGTIQDAAEVKYWIAEWILSMPFAELSYRCEDSNKDGVVISRTHKFNDDRLSAYLHSKQILYPQGVYTSVYVDKCATGDVFITLIHSDGYKCYGYIHIPQFHLESPSLIPS